MALYELDAREHATILAALRYWQRHHAPRSAEMADKIKSDHVFRSDLPQLDIACCGGELVPMMRDEIDPLCERINCGSATLADCVAAFYSTVKDDRTERLIAAARDQYHRDGEIEIDDSTTVSGTGPDVGGEYVLAWVWVSDEETEESTGDEIKAAHAADVSGEG